MNPFKKLIPSSLVGQMVTVVLLALLVAQLLSLIILGMAYKSVITDSNRMLRFQQVHSLVDLLEDSPEDLYPAVLSASRTPYTWFTVTQESQVDSREMDRVERRLKKRLKVLLGNDYSNRIRVQARRESLENTPELSECDDPKCSRTRNHNGKHARKMEHRQREQFRKASKLISLKVSVQMQNGLWLNLRASAPTIPPLAAGQTVIFLLISIILVLLTLAIMVRRITRPLHMLTVASQKLGMGEQVESLPVKGPKDIKETIHAFNEMNHRLQRFVSDRTRMLAALSHDLRTPITTMRLRVELMPESSDRDRLLVTLNEMQQMSEATLAFMRQASDNEVTRKVELNSMLSSMCDDYADLGKNVTFVESDEVIISCRPVSLKRAFRNLIENAVNYGEQARVSLQASDNKVSIIIEDSGPGIPQERMEKVFEPFFRLESSRNRDTGGIGLGMAIARNVIRNHGGDIMLENTECGLKVEVEVVLFI